jgi:enamine deaminase RidA (YjgF/YER057c/UK114 family)
MSSISEIQSGRWDATFDTHYSNATLVNGMLFVSGQLPLDADGRLVGAGDVVAQARCVFENLGGVLAEAGAAFADVLDTRIYLLDIGDIPRIAPIRREFLGDRRPAATAVEVSKLVVPGAIVEVSVVAAVGQGT